MKSEQDRRLVLAIDNKLRNIRDAGWIAREKNELVPEVYETRNQILSVLKELGYRKVPELKVARYNKLSFRNVAQAQLDSIKRQIEAANQPIESEG